MTDSKRRSFLKTAGGVAAGAAITAAPVIAADPPAIRWRLASSFPKSLETLFGGAEYFCQRVSALTDGKFEIRAYAAGEIVPGLKVFDAVQDGTIECGQTASYYYVGKNKALAFDCAIPFGLTTRQQNSWMYYGGGLQLMRDFFKEFNIVNFPAGNTGTQMGGWFRNEVKSLKDLKGLKMRIPGIGGEIMAKLGVIPQTLAAGDIYPALEKGTIDATEFVGPYDDEKLGFYKIAKHYYYPGWWEPETQITMYANAKEWEKLPKPYQEAFASACAEANLRIVADYDQRNPEALLRLVSQGVKLHAFPKDMMAAAYKAAFELYDDEAGKNPAFKKIYTEWLKFRAPIQRWFGLAEATMENFMYTAGAKR